MTWLVSLLGDILGDAATGALTEAATTTAAGAAVGSALGSGAAAGSTLGAAESAGSVLGASAVENPGGLFSGLLSGGSSLDAITPAFEGLSNQVGQQAQDPVVPDTAQSPWDFAQNAGRNYLNQQLQGGNHQQPIPPMPQMNATGMSPDSPFMQSYPQYSPSPFQSFQPTRRLRY